MRQSSASSPQARSTMVARSAGEPASTARRKISLTRGSQSAMLPPRGDAVGSPSNARIGHHLHAEGGRISSGLAQPLEEPGAGQGPEAVGGPAADPQRIGSLLVAHAGEVAELDEPRGRLVVPLQFGERLVEGEREVGPSLDVRREVVEVEPPERPPALSVTFPRARLTRMRRIASAAAAKKWARPCQGRPGSPPTSRRYASWTRAVGCSVCPGLSWVSLEAASRRSSS